MDFSSFQLRFLIDFDRSMPPWSPGGHRVRCPWCTTPRPSGSVSGSALSRGWVSGSRSPWAVGALEINDFQLIFKAFR